MVVCVLRKDYKSAQYRVQFAPHATESVTRIQGKGDLEYFSLAICNMLLANSKSSNSLLPYDTLAAISTSKGCPKLPSENTHVTKDIMGYMAKWGVMRRRNGGVVEVQPLPEAVEAQWSYREVPYREAPHREASHREGPQWPHNSPTMAPGCDASRCDAFVRPLLGHR